MFENEDIGEYDFRNDTVGRDESQNLGDTTLIGLNRQEVVTADEKLTALKTNYEDPFADLLKHLSHGGDEPVTEGYTAPSQISPTVTDA